MLEGHQHDAWVPECCTTRPAVLARVPVGCSAPERQCTSMTEPPTSDPEVLIIGAGPTGLVLALMLRHQGVSVRIVDQEAEAGTTSRALAVQARTLEWYQQIGLSDAVLDHGRRVDTINLWVAGKRRVRIGLDDLGTGLSPFPHPIIFPQDEHEHLLINRLALLGVVVDRQITFVEASESGGHVIAHLRRQDGAIETCTASYLAGCDGARSAVRAMLQVGFPGGTYDHLFYVADVALGDGAASGPDVTSGPHSAGASPGTGWDGELHVGLDASDFLAVFPLAGEGRVRLVGTAIRDHTQSHPALTFADVSRQVIGWMHLDIRQVNWFSTYRVHHRVADCFRRDRVFLLGDAAHVHSPVGGQGMNTGIGDAINLAWKLAAVLQDRALPALLETYEPERIAFARRLVRTTDQGFIGVTSSSVLARTIRLRLVPLLAPLVFAIRAMRRLLFRTVSQISVSYRGCSDLSTGTAGTVHGGDRLPWVTFPGGSDNYVPLRSLDWQLHVYGEVSEGIRAVGRQYDLPLHGFPWIAAMGRAGLRRSAAYLVRPDGHIDIIDADGESSMIIAYLKRWKIRGSAVQG